MQALYQWQLSGEDLDWIRDHYLEEQGVPHQYLSAVGFADTQPDTLAHQEALAGQLGVPVDSLTVNASAELGIRERRALDRRVIIRFIRF